MSTQIYTVPVGAPVRVLAGDNGSFCAQPGAAGTVMLEYSYDGVNFITYNTSGTGLAIAMAARTVGLGQFGVVRATAIGATATLIAADVGQNGFYGTGPYSDNTFTLINSAVAMATPSATAEGNVFALRLPAGLLKANFRIDVDAMFSCTNNVNVKTIKAYMGNTGSGTAFASQVLTSLAGAMFRFSINGRNDGANLIGNSVGSAGGWGGSTTAPTAISSNAAYTTAEQELYITSTKATGADTLTLDAVVAKLYQ